jgi:hypothetical protein
MRLVICDGFTGCILLEGGAYWNHHAPTLQLQVKFECCTYRVTSENFRTAQIWAVKKSFKSCVI